MLNSVFITNNFIGAVNRSVMIQQHYKVPMPGANGNGGQFIFFWTPIDMLLVSTGGNYDRRNIKNDAGEAFVYIVPSIKEMQRYLILSSFFLVSRSAFSDNDFL